MRILIIWAESINRYTGGSSHFWGLMRGIQSIGWQIRAIVPRYSRTETSRKARGSGLPSKTAELSLVEDISFVPLPSRSFISFLLLQVVTVLWLPYWLVKYRPAAVYARTCFLVFLMHAICRLAGVPLILEVDAIVDKEVEMRGQRQVLAHIVRALDRLNYRSADGVLCVTPGIREEVIRRGAKPDTSVVIHNAAQTDIMRPMDQKDARRQLGLAEDDYIVGFAGTLAPWQGLDLLVQAAQEVIDNAPRPVRFVLVGDGQCRQQLEQMVGQLGLGVFFSFLAPVPSEEVAVFNNACDVIVCPRYDPRTLRYGMSALKFWDAVSVGVPVLVPKGSQLDDVLARLGLPEVFPPGDKKQLAEAIVEVLKNTEHYQSRRKDVHRIVSEQYSWTRVAEKLAEHCRRLKVKTQ
ncbi:MAG: glycosyltransferase family 4 protein [Desulfobacteraceae bacterium]|nr:glycosyltransferase family 4 protein [Desulfobacteraceae bacterium]